MIFAGTDESVSRGGDVGVERLKGKREGLKGGKGVGRPPLSSDYEGLLDGRQENGAMKLGLPWPRYRDRPVSRNEKEEEEEEEGEEVNK